MRPLLCLLVLLSLQVANADNVGSAVVAKVETIKDLEQLTARSKRGQTYLAGTGSGCFVSPEGRVITNHHVVDGAAEIVVVHNGTAYQMRIVKKNKDKDLALLEFDGLGHEINGELDFSKFKKPSFPFVDIRRDEIGVGEQITVIGYPQIQYQGLEAKVTRGIVSSCTGFKGDKDNFQMDAAISGGNSGGPVFDDAGNLAGVTVARFAFGENANYAIKLGVVKKFVDGVVDLSAGDARIHDNVSARVADMIKSTVLVLNFKTGARPHDIETKGVREGNESKARTEKTILYAELLRVKKEWKELKEVTDGLIGSGFADDGVVGMNNQAREELGLHLVVYAEVDGADVKARIKPICGIRDSFVQCEEPFAVDGGSLKRGFPIKAELSYHTPQGALWKGSVDEIYDWRGTKEIRIKLTKVVVK